MVRFPYRAPREQVICPACAAASLAALAVYKLPRPVNNRRTGFISGCDECGLVFVNPLPSDEELAELYSPDGDWGRPRGAGHEHEEDERPTKPGSKKWRAMFAATAPELDVTRPPAGARVLDFGCGTGKFLDVLQDCGWTTFGIETAFDQAFVRHRRLAEIPRDATFDLVIAHHVLEHITRPLDLLRQLAGACRIGGYLLVSVPRLDTLPQHGDYKYMINRTHVTAYTRACMETLFARSGWRPLDSPADEIIVGGRATSKRLRLLAARTDRPIPAPRQPLRSARASLGAYQQAIGSRPRLERLGLVRLSAGIREGRRQLRHRTRQGMSRALAVFRPH